MTDRKGNCRSQQQQKTIARRADQTRAVDFFNILTGPELLEITEAHLPAHRERLYPPTVALSMFINQVLDADGSCQASVNRWAAQRMVEGLNPRSIATGGYCKARQRLPLALIKTLACETGRLLCAQSDQGWQWRGRKVKLIDGTGLSMPDTALNQERYPQPASQGEGVGFPHARMVGVTCLSTGAILATELGTHAGKGQGELGLLRRLEGVFEPGDVVLADALYCSYFLLAELQALGVDMVFAQHGSRHTDFRCGERLGVRDHLLDWTKPARPPWMTASQYAAVPSTLTVREAKVGGRVLVTTLLEPHDVPKNELKAVYAQRWQVELDIRNIKTTLGMDVLRCQTPDMVEKEVWVYLLAYNLIRLLMAQAAWESGLQPREVSFKHTLQLWVEWQRVGYGRHTSESYAALFFLIAQNKVGNRPGRIEPRVCKRRPKSSKWLKEPREQARQRMRDHQCVL